MEKVYRKAVRVFVFDNSKVLSIKYCSGENREGYYDLPGGKIEDDETSIEAAIREVKEETNLDVDNLEYAGNLIIEYEEKIFDFDVYTTNNFKGNIIGNEDNDVLWEEIDSLIKESKKYLVISLLDDKYKKELMNHSDFKYHFMVDDNHRLIKEV